MAATGNVKISELTNHITNLNGKEMFPLSWSADGTSSYESYKTYLSTIGDYVGDYLNLTTPGGDKDSLNSYGKHLSYLERDLGQYAGELDGNFCANHSKDLIVDSTKRNKVIWKDGTLKTKSGWSLSQQIPVSEGTLYLLKLPEGTTIEDGQALFAKLHSHTYYTIDHYEIEIIIGPDGTEIEIQVPVYGPAQTKEDYEAISFHYDQFDATVYPDGYGIPKSNYVIFYAAEDENIVIACPDACFTTGAKVYATHYAIFSEVAEKFLGASSDLTQVISEAISTLEGRVQSLEADVDTIGDATANSIDFMELPKFRGFPMIINADHAPKSSMYYVDEYGTYMGDTVTAYQHVADIPNFAGQIWVSSVDEAGAQTPSAWFAVKSTDYSGWKKLSFA